MNLNHYKKETITLFFYCFYLLITYLLYINFPGDTITPNYGVLALFLLIPISLIYASYQVIKHFKTNVSYIYCLLIHTLVWLSIITYLTKITK